MIMLVISFTGCKSCKPETKITPEDLIGNWNFQSLTFNNFLYDTEPELAGLDLTYSYVQLSFIDVTTTEIGLLDHRGSLTPYTKNYTLSNNIINFDNDSFVFHIENWETFNGTVLMVKFVSSNETNEAPINGIFTMIR